jgi:pimeloyl-ACP methyl ester carboxylesterase
VVIYLHGLWLGGHESFLLRRRLQDRYGLDVAVFKYPSISATMAEVTARLQDFVEKQAPAELHLLGHSLGGLVAYRFLERFPEQPPGRVVFLGTPAIASRAASNAARSRWAGMLLGRCVSEELLIVRRREWTSSRALGIIAGTHRVGLGQFVARFDEPCDGTVAVSETRMPGATDHVTLPVSHMGMLLSARVAHEAGEFFCRGHFSLRAAP